MVSWTPEPENSLRQSLTSNPVLRCPDYTKPLLLQTDASDRDPRAVLSQQVDVSDHPIAFASNKLLPQETKYSTIEKERYAIIWAVQKFHPYLSGREFEVQTDHRPLVWLQDALGNNARLLCWSLALQPYHMPTIEEPTTRPLMPSVMHQEMKVSPEQFMYILLHPEGEGCAVSGHNEDRDTMCIFPRIDVLCICCIVSYCVIVGCS